MEGELEIVGSDGRRVGNSRLASHAAWRNCVQDVYEEGWPEEVEENLVSSGTG